MKWTCKKIELFLDDYLEDKLSVRDKFTYEAHVESCSRCRKYFHDMSAFIEKVRGEARIRARARQEAGQVVPQRVVDAFAALPMRKQVLLAEAVRREAEEEDKRWKEWAERARKRREPARPN